jgi:hypothetical protein
LLLISINHDQLQTSAGGIKKNMPFDTSRVQGNNSKVVNFTQIMFYKEYFYYAAMVNIQLQYVTK